MAKRARNSKVDAYLKKATRWQAEMRSLREIILACPVTEDLKWGKPCYSFRESNLVVLLPLKNYCTVLFCKGALLKDPHGILVQTTKNTQSARYLRFTDNREIVRGKSILKAYIHEAIEAEKRGLKVIYKDTADYPVPEEFKNELDRAPGLKTAFTGLTPGRQRGYLLYFSGAKQSKTRAARVEKCVPLILGGKGLHDDR